MSIRTTISLKTGVASALLFGLALNAPVYSADEAASGSSDQLAELCQQNEIFKQQCASLLQYCEQVRPEECSRATEGLLTQMQTIQVPVQE